MAKQVRKSGGGKNRPIQKSAAKKSKNQRNSVHVGLHGLGRILRVIHGAPGNLQKDFEAKLGSAHVVLKGETATKIKNFVSENLPDHPINAEMTNCDCDPVTDPYCICFGFRR